jgi:ferric-chelate reductase (NADPH)
MASAKAWLGAVVGRLVFREVRTVEIRDLGPSFRHVFFRGEALRGVDWEPGDKIQVFLPNQGMRTYTPGAEWGRRLAVGDRWQFFGPRRSIRASELDGPIVLFGDETSFGVARAMTDAKGLDAVRCVFEVSDAAESSDVLSKLGVSGALLQQRTSGDAHLAETCDRIVDALRANPRAALVMTGKAQSIQALRARLKERDALRPGNVKAYWSVGKAGLD